MARKAKIVRLSGALERRNNREALLKRIRSGEEPSRLKTEVSAALHLLHPSPATVSGETWLDLGMDHVFRKIDRTVSAPGSQFLYYWLFRSSTDPRRPQLLSEGYRTILENQEICTQADNILLKLRGRECAAISGVVYGTQPEKPRTYPLYLVLPLLFIAAVAGLFISKSFILAVLLMGAVNMFVQQRAAMKISSHIPHMGSLGRMLSVAMDLAGFSDFDTDELNTIRSNKESILSLQRKCRWLLLDSSSMDELSGSVVAYINNLLLVNIIMFFSAAVYIETHRKALQEVFEAIGSLDMRIAAGRYMMDNRCCVPRLSEKNIINVEGLYHPLLEKPVPNDFSLKEKSCLITGSNMAGKTTFIKTIGLNLILAETLGFCHAESAVFPAATVLSTIRRADDLEHGKSYYFVEIENILKFIQTCSSERYLLLIDEIFRGTNTVERLSASAAVLSYLADRATVLVTTHDIELGDMLGDNFSMFHFQERIDGDRHYFDYCINPGACRSRNAIRLLQITGYPHEIVSNARSWAESMLKKD